MSLRSSLLVVFAGLLLLTACRDETARLTEPERRGPTRSLRLSYMGESYGLADDIGHLGFGASWTPRIADDGSVAGPICTTDYTCGDPSPARWTPASGLQSLAAPPGCMFQSLELGGVSSNGIIAGTLACGSSGQDDTYAYRWSEEAGLEVLSRPVCDGYAFVRGYAVNRAGTVAGAVTTCSGWLLAVWSPEGVRQDIPLPEPYLRQFPAVTHISDAGHVVGWIDVRPDPIVIFLWSEATGWRFISHASEDLSPYGVNSNGTVVGRVGLWGVFRWTASRGLEMISEASGMEPVLAENDHIAGSYWTGQETRAYRWTPAVGFEDIGHMPIEDGQHVHTQVLGISPTGVLTGSTTASAVNSVVQERAFRWSPDAGFEDLGVLTGGKTRGFSINSAGEVAGIWWAESDPATARWVRWRMGAGNQAPIVSLVPLQKSEFDEGESVQVEAEIEDPDFDPLDYVWDFGDGSTHTGALEIGANARVSTTHAWTDDSAVPVSLSLSVTDARGLSAMATTQVIVRNVGPAVTVSGASIPAGSYQLQASFFDPGLADGPWAYTVDWGDGSAPESGSIAEQIAGARLIPGSHEGSTPVPASHVYSSAGGYFINVRVVDKDGGVGAGSIFLTVESTNVPPTADAGLDVAVALDGARTAAVTLDGRGSADDGQLQPLTYSWSKDGAEIATGATPTVNLAAGSHTLTLTVNDGAFSASDDVVITVVDPTPPVITSNVAGTLGNAGWYVSDITVSWTVSDLESNVGSSGCTASNVGEDTPGVSFTCEGTSAGGTSTETVSVKRDATDPTLAFVGNAGSYTVDQRVEITCTAADEMSGVASSTCSDVVGDAYAFELGQNTFSATAADHAGNAATASTSFTVGVTTTSLGSLTQRFVTHRGVARSLKAKLDAAARATTPEARAGQVRAYINEVRAQAGKALSHEHAAVLIRLAEALNG